MKEDKFTASLAAPKAQGRLIVYMRVKATGSSLHLLPKQTTSF